LLGKGEVGDRWKRHAFTAETDTRAYRSFFSAVFLAGPTLAQEKSIVVASTTSTKDTGLFEHLLPLFTQKTGIAVNVGAVGTGQALDMARRGDADVVFVHAELAEQAFIAEGHGVKRCPVMYNDFVLIGPESDPAGIKGMKDVAKALKAIKDKSATFISRGDNSGTHQFELMLWNKDVGINIQATRRPLVQIGRAGDEGYTPYGARDRWLCALRSRHLGFFREQG
jgi:tungstate transport system substrate-binding protein